MTAINTFQTRLLRPVSIWPLVTFRIFFGLLMFAATLRFLLKGWVDELYIQPQFHFPFFGWNWIQVYSPLFIYSLYALMLVFSLGVALGLLYRVSIAGFFLIFSYVEFIDKTYYLNHYYFIILTGFILIFLPAHCNFSLDQRWIRRDAPLHFVPRWMILALKLQLIFVYFFAGVAKINSDWLFHAKPLSIWLPPLGHLPVIGYWMGKTWIAFLLSWAGCFFDLTVGFFLFFRKTRIYAWVVLVIFHLITGILFPIGMFPYVMISLTTIFFSDRWHASLWKRWNKHPYPHSTPVVLSFGKRRLYAVAVIFILQLAVANRSYFYSGHVFWTEQGFRFSWRVMLMEKSGTVFFTVKDPATGKSFAVINRNYLTPLQEKMVATQPDMLVDVAHLLKREFMRKGISNPQVFAESYVTLNGRPSRLLINPEVDLATQQNSILSKSYITNSPRDLW